MRKSPCEKRVVFRVHVVGFKGLLYELQILASLHGPFGTLSHTVIKDFSMW